MSWIQTPRLEVRARRRGKDEVVDRLGCFSCSNPFSLFLFSYFYHHAITIESGSFFFLSTTSPLVRWGACSKPAAYTALGRGVWSHSRSLHLICFCSPLLNSTPDKADCAKRKGGRPKICRVPPFSFFFFPFLFKLWVALLITAISLVSMMGACGFVDESEHFDSERASGFVCVE